jgi:hypothetical protein
MMITRGAIFLGTGAGFLSGYFRFRHSQTPLTGLVLDTLYGAFVGLFWPVSIGFATLAYGDFLILRARNQIPN